MASLPLRFAVALLLTSACGGQIEPDPGTSRPSQAGTNPNTTTRKDPCGRVCDRMVTVCAAYTSVTADACAADCTSQYEGDPQAALRYAECIEGLSCDDIRRGMSMDYGPLGACWARAHGR
jgi:hypothetical protein